MPIRTRTDAPSGQAWAASARWASTPHDTAAAAEAKATKNESPCVSTSYPPHTSKPARIRSRCCSSTTAYRSRSRSRSFVDPSISVNIRVTDPSGAAVITCPPPGSQSDGAEPSRGGPRGKGGFAPVSRSAPLVHVGGGKTGPSGGALPQQEPRSLIGPRVDQRPAADPPRPGLGERLGQLALAGEHCRDRVVHRRPVPERPEQASEHVPDRPVERAGQARLVPF